MVHLKSEMPSMDDGERQNAVSTNYTIDFNIEVEMSAPYAFTYFSQCEQKYLNIDKLVDTDGCISVLRAIKTEIPQFDEHIWNLMVTTEYLIEESDLNKEMEIDLDGFFAGTDL